MHYSIFIFEIKNFFSKENISFKRTEKFKIMSLLANTEKVLNFLDENNEVRKEYHRLLEASNLNSAVPPFFSSNSSGQQMVYSAVMKLTKDNILSTMRKQYPRIMDINNLRIEFQKMKFQASPKYMKYSEYCALKQKWPEKYSNYLTSKLFFDLSIPQFHTIRPEDLYMHLSIQSVALTFYHKLMQIDKKNKGALTKTKFSLFVRDISSRFPFMENIIKTYAEDGQSMYIVFVTEKFFTELDPLQTGTISIQKIISSELFLELIKLEIDRQNNRSTKNIFCEQLALLYFDDFYDMDTDEDGILAKDDLLHMPSTRFTESFVNRLFDSMILSEVFDFSWFCRFKSAYNNLGKPWANQIFFDILDIDNNGEINETEMNYFFHDLSRDFSEFFKRDPPSFKDYINELRDSCSITNSIAKSEFIQSKESYKLVKHLVDLKAYAKWECGEDIPARSDCEEDENSSISS
ncbi:hypothetical protein TRFO_19490 [Tritrichomonas foetus]|uniref:EF-hand domain-containing protein n=1 Tax=Tritrichomonas foetus TaxID=1144522 RepID=A0A1J4KNL3_9EUKA|nr:hypothetical protein TRFO_19490 [Tritrichomonas foetus]|eukprot:OHT10997.1 hypothetical protein TRFO_19490 [Tritrichomonas foetus]